MTFDSDLRQDFSQGHNELMVQNSEILQMGSNAYLKDGRLETLLSDQCPQAGGILALCWSNKAAQIPVCFAL